MSDTVVLSNGARRAWQVVQGVVFLVGVVIVAALLFAPATGLFLLWDVLIPVAPLLLVVAPGVWRNVCPLGTFSVLPSQLKLSRRLHVSRAWQSRLLAIAVALLLIIVPLRHPLLDRYGVVTGIVLLVVALAAIGLGSVFDLKSAWCSGLCPVYPVELLYGSRPVIPVPNVQCRVCTACVAPCRDSRPGITPTDAARTGSGRAAAELLVGGFPGFVLGWYLVELHPGWTPVRQVLQSYALPFAGLAATFAIYLVLRRVLPQSRTFLERAFAAAAIVIYYWFKLPVVFGMTGDGTHALIMLKGTLPAWSVWALRSMMSLLLIYLLLARTAGAGWSPRPPAAPVVTTQAS